MRPAGRHRGAALGRLAWPAILAPLLAACALPPANVGVRHFASTEYYENGAYWHIFLFEPSQRRSLDDRLSLARRQIASEGGCRWVGAPRDSIVAQTDRQGRGYADTTLAAPVACDA